MRSRSLGSSRPNTPGLASGGLRRSVEVSRQTPKTPEMSAAPATSAAYPTSTGSGAGGWGWGSVWNTASAALAQAKERVDEQVKNLPQIPQNEQARKWGEGMMDYVKQAQLDKIAQDLKTTSLSTLTGIMNVVAPPIAEHEVIQVTLSHDMEGYDGVETLVYRALARILEQVEGGDLVVNKGKESRPKDEKNRPRNLNAVEGLDAALKLSEAEINEQMKIQAETPSRASSGPVTYSPVYLRIQPYTSVVPSVAFKASDSPSTSDSTKQTLQFLLYLSDPGHQLVHTATTQSVPLSWITLWDLDDSESGTRKNGEWIEDVLVEALRVGVETIGQEYVVARMGWDAAVKASEGPVENAPLAETTAH